MGKHREAKSPSEELTRWKSPSCWERWKAGGEGVDRGWDGWMASLTQWTWVWVNSGSWWWTGRPGVLQSVGSQRAGHDWGTELNGTETQRMLHSWMVEPTLNPCSFILIPTYAVYSRTLPHTFVPSEILRKNTVEILCFYTKKCEK